MILLYFYYKFYTCLYSVSNLQLRHFHGFPITKRNFWIGRKTALGDMAMAFVSRVLYILCLDLYNAISKMCLQYDNTCWQKIDGFQDEISPDIKN